MAGWNGYVDNLMSDGQCQDAAIVGYTDSKYVWASVPGGALSAITPTEIDVFVGKDRQSFFTNGMVLGGKKCSVIRDNLFEAECTMDVRTKSAAKETTYNITIAKADSILVIAMGKEGVHGGVLNSKAFTMAKYLKESGF
uniref:profilin-2-like isoform X1 n=1 Tax=Pristiophorus japonicus TaxID=55135 RepID=UPI00398F1DDB